MNATHFAKIEKMHPTTLVARAFEEVERSVPPVPDFVVSLAKLAVLLAAIVFTVGVSLDMANPTQAFFTWLWGAVGALGVFVVVGSFLGGGNPLASLPPAEIQRLLSSLKNHPQGSDATNVLHDEILRRTEPPRSRPIRYVHLTRLKRAALQRLPPAPPPAAEPTLAARWATVASEQRAVMLSKTKD